MPRSYLSTLNTTLNTPFDFTCAEWSCVQLPHDYAVRVHVTLDGQHYEGVSMINTNAWQMLATKGRQLALQAAIITTASNLIDAWKADIHAAVLRIPA